MSFLSLLLFISCAKVIQCNKYSFGVFENTKGLKDIYTSELIFHKSLLATRELLKSRRDLLLHHRNESSFKIIPKLEMVYYPLNTDAMGPSSYQRTKRGFLVLLDTYKFDLNALLKGVLRNKGRSFEVKSREKLTPTDLLDLSKEAFNYTWFDSSISLLHTYLKYQNDSSIKSFREKLVEIHNMKLRKNLQIAGEDFKVFPYLIDPATLKKNKKQPKVISRTNFFDRNVSHLPIPAKLYKLNLKEYDNNKVSMGNYMEENFRRLCREEIEVPNNTVGKCIFLHHKDPYLQLGPFKLEIVSLDPPRMILVDFFTEKEMTFIKEKSYPALSEGRPKKESIKEGQKQKKVRIIHKSVQHWMEDITYKENVFLKIIRGAINKFDKDFVDWFEEKLPKDMYGYEVINPILKSLSHKIQIATRLNVLSRWGSSKYQVTNYGLGGLCEIHLDPHGMMLGNNVPDDRSQLFRTGDMLLTLMGWLDDVGIGGSTAFMYPGREALFRPTKGSAAIWFNLHRNGKNNRATMHGGCPVVEGSKWILNKWIFYFDQMNNYPCGLDEFEDYKVFDNSPYG